MGVQSVIDGGRWRVDRPIRRPGVKVDEACYYYELLLSQQLLPVVHRVVRVHLSARQCSVQGHAS